MASIRIHHPDATTRGIEDLPAIGRPCRLLSGVGVRRKGLGRPHRVRIGTVGLHQEDPGAAIVIRDERRKTLRDDPAQPGNSYPPCLADRGPFHEPCCVLKRRSQRQGRAAGGRRQPAPGVACATPTAFCSLSRILALSPFASNRRLVSHHRLRTLRRVMSRGARRTCRGATRGRGRPSYRAAGPLASSGASPRSLAPPPEPPPPHAQSGPATQAGAANRVAVADPSQTK